MAMTEEERKAKRREYNHKWRTANAEKRRESNRKWRTANAEKVREHKRRHYANQTKESLTASMLQAVSKLSQVMQEANPL